MGSPGAQATAVKKAAIAKPSLLLAAREKTPSLVEEANDEALKSVGTAHSLTKTWIWLDYRRFYRVDVCFGVLSRK